MSFSRGNGLKICFKKYYQGPLTEFTSQDYLKLWSTRGRLLFFKIFFNLFIKLLFCACSWRRCIWFIIIKIEMIWKEKIKINSYSLDYFVPLEERHLKPTISWKDSSELSTHTNHHQSFVGSEFITVIMHKYLSEISKS